MDTSAIETLVLPVLTIGAGIITSLITTGLVEPYIHQIAQRVPPNPICCLDWPTPASWACARSTSNVGGSHQRNTRILLPTSIHPYLELGGNGTVKKMVDNEINRLPIQHQNDLDIIAKEK